MSSLTSSINNNSLVYDTLNSLPKFIDRLINQINSTVDFLNNSRSDFAFLLLEDIAEGIDVYIQLIGLIHQSIPLNKDHQFGTGSSIRQIEIHLLSVIKAIKVAKAKEDKIMLSDLLEYELKDNLTQWKIEVIPLLKQTI